MLDPESVILNLVQNIFRAGLFQHLNNSMCYETLIPTLRDRVTITDNYYCCMTVEDK